MAQQTQKPDQDAPHTGSLSSYPRPQIEDLILHELGERRRARRQTSEPLRQALDRLRPDSTPGPRPQTPGPPLPDRRHEISDLLFYLDAGYLELTVPDHRQTPGAP